MTGYSTKQAAERIGVSRQVLLTWERRFGWPCPPRRNNGQRAYSEETVTALSQVPSWQSAGMNLRHALDNARRLAEGSARPNVNERFGVEQLQEILEDLDQSVVVMSGPNFVIEFANASHRRLYPGRRLLGLPASEVLTHSVSYFDILSALRHVAATGETLRWAEQMVPVQGEEHWWNFSYGRLPTRPGEPVRVLLLARDVTNDVQARRRAEARSEEAHIVAQGAQHAAEAFNALLRIIERAQTGSATADLAVLRHLQDAFHADEVSAWVEDRDNLQRLAAVGGEGTQLPGSDHETLLPIGGSLLRRALIDRQVIEVPAAELWPEAGEERLVAVVPVSAGRRAGVMLIVQKPGRRLDTERRQLLRAVSIVLNLSAGGHPF